MKYKLVSVMVVGTTRKGGRLEEGDSRSRVSCCGSHVMSHVMLCTVMSCDPMCM